MKVKEEISAGGIVCKVTQPRTTSGAGFRNWPKSSTLWLITQHSKFGHWSFPKGLVGDIDDNEKMEDAALREVAEEGGVKAEIVNDKPITVKYNYKWPRPKPAQAKKLLAGNEAGKQGTLVKKTVHYYLMQYLSGDPADHDWEVSEAKFTTAEEVEKLLTFKNDKVALRQALTLIGGK